MTLCVYFAYIPLINDWTIPIETRDKLTATSASSLLKETRGYESKPNTSVRANGSALFSTVFSLRLNTQGYRKRTQHSNLWQEQLAGASQLTADAHRLRLLGEQHRRAGGLMPPIEWSGTPRKYWLLERCGHLRAEELNRSLMSASYNFTY